MKRAERPAGMMIVPLMLLMLTAFAGVARAADQTWHCMSPSEVAKHEVRADNLVLGGIAISEEPGQLSHLQVIKASFTARNQTSKDFHVALEILGSNDKGPVFAMSVAPGFAGTVSPNSNQPATEAVFAAPGELAQATQICVRFVGDF
jgi:hypothetical protein